MKKASWIIAFFVVVIAGDRLAGLFLQKQINASQFRYSRMYRGDAAADILVIGNSKGLNLFIPAIEKATSQKAFSLCYNGMPTVLASTLVQDYIDRYPKVKTVVVELCMVELAETELITEFNSYIKDSKRVDSLIKITNKQAWISSKISHLYRFNNEVFQRALYYRNRIDNDWTMDKTISSRMKQEAAKVSIDFTGDSLKLQRIKMIVDFCKERNIKVKLLITPFYPDVTLKNIETLKTRAQLITGLPVLDYSHSITRDEHFADFLHLNQNGSIEFVSLIANDGIFR
jgi:hypothetical protein